MLSMFIKQVNLIAITCAVLYCTGCREASSEAADSQSPPKAASASTTTIPPVKDQEPALGDSNQPPSDKTPSTSKIIVYYFHRTARCPTCLSIEHQSQEAVESGFIDEINSGRIEWRAVDIEQPENKHYESDFALASSSLIFVEMEGETTRRWRTLERVWELVEDPQEFQLYVWSELTQFAAE